MSAVSTSGGALGVSLDITMIPKASIIAGRLSMFAGAIRSVEEPLSDIIEDVVIPRFRENFNEEGPGWKKLSEWTPFMPYRREHNAAGNPILNVTGTLRRGATNKSNWDIDNQSGTAILADIPEAPYWSVHEFGASNRGLDDSLSDVPARPFAQVTEADVDKMEEIFERFVIGRLGVAW